MTPPVLVLPTIIALLVSSGWAAAKDEKSEVGGRTPESCQGQERFYNGWCVVDPRILRKAAPEYPQLAEAERVEATVRIRAIIQENGSVANPRVLECTSPGYGFEESALRAVKKWKYVPARVNGEIRAVYFDVIVNFKR